MSSRSSRGWPPTARFLRSMMPCEDGWHGMLLVFQATRGSIVDSVAVLHSGGRGCLAWPGLAWLSVRPALPAD